MTTKPRIAIIGPGALGTLFAARLAPVADVVLLDYKPERAAALSKSGIVLLEDEGERHVHLAITADPSVLATVDSAILLVKAYQTEQAALTLSEFLPPGSIVLTLQNGLGNIETLQAHLGQGRVFGGTTAQGAILEEPGVVRDTGKGPLTLGRPDGRPDPRLDDLCAIFLHAGFPVSITGELLAAIWTKAILNAAINPVAALTHLRNGELVEHEESLKLMTAAAREAHRVALAHGLGIPKTDWAARLTHICNATAGNINSMLQDVLRKRRTEIEALNGAVVRIAEKHRLLTPVNRSLWYLIATLQETYQKQA